MPDTRTIILTADGRHCTVGRFTAPTEAEIAATEDALRRQCVGGAWLASMEGDYYGRWPVSLRHLRVLGAPPGVFPDAVAAFETERARVTSR